MALTEEWDWQVGVFCQNEADRIGPCLASIAAAARGLRVCVTILLNGTTDDSGAVALSAARLHRLPAAIYRVDHGDKSHAINLFFGALAAPAARFCCVDAYATMAPGTLAGFARVIARNPHARLVTGVPTNGRTMRLAARRTLEVGGILHGQLYGGDRRFVQALAARRIRLPLGLYRSDGLLGFIAACDLDAVGTEWDDRRIAGVAEAAFAIRPLSPTNLRDIRRQFRRTIRQMRGRLENAAIGAIAYDHGFAALPDSADEMIRCYLQTHAPPRVGQLEWPFMRMAIRQAMQARPPAQAALRPRLVAATDALRHRALA